MLTFKTPYLHNSSIKGYAGYIALFAALLFACHPLQTQAVTYIWQRVTSFCTMFYLLSLVAYIKWRLYTHEGQRDRGTEAEAERPRHETGVKTVLLYLLSLICTILAMKTKEIAFMLPVMLTLHEMIFFKGKIQKRVLYLIPFLVTMLIIPLSLMNIDRPIGELIGDIDETVKGHTELSRREYLLVQFRVLVTYLRLIFLPVNQNLEYDYPKYGAFFNIEVFSSFVFLAILFGLSIYILFRYRDSAPHTRLISFGIIWFFVNLLLESSIIPLYNVIFEHRMYLPSVGVFLAVTTVVFMAIDRWKTYARVITVMLAIIIIVLTGATYARNSVWKDELTLWQDVVNKSPNKDIAHYNLANVFQTRGLNDNAVRHYQKAIEFNPQYSEAYNNLGNIFLSQGLIDQAMEQFLIAIKINRFNSDAFYNLGNAYASQGLSDKAIEQYMTAIKINPYFPEARINLGNAYSLEGHPDRAIKQYLLALKLNPEHPKARHNLGAAYQSKGLLAKAIKEYLLALKLKPDYPEVHYNLGIAYKSRGDTELAIRSYNNALRIRPGWELPRKALDQISNERESGES
jgi:tetratricopeptide (TPR) repeat protein